MYTVLITSMGGAGSKNLVETIQMFDKENKYRIIGTHCDPYELVKADIKDLHIVPKAINKEEYFKAHLKIIEDYKVDVLIVNSDREVDSLSSYIDQIPCRHLLPGAELVSSVQDKFSLHSILKKHGCEVVPNYAVDSIEALPEIISRFQEGEKFWVRLREGAGSLGATWLYNAEQAKKWIELWVELRGFAVTDFVLAPFLSGRDFCVALLFQNGELAIGKAYERLRYLTGGISISNMGSTPSASRTVDEKDPIDISVRAVRAVYEESGTKPHGYYQLDMKCDEAGQAYVTEINIGRFPMTSPQFDRVGKYNLLQLYLQMLLEPEIELPRNYYDFDPGIVMLRSVDALVKFVKEEDIKKLERRLPC